jgi:hypothetical protein
MAALEVSDISEQSVDFHSDVAIQKACRHRPYWTAPKNPQLYRLGVFHAQLQLVATLPMIDIQTIGRL